MLEEAELVKLEAACRAVPRTSSQYVATNIERKFFRVLGLTKVTVLLAFTLVGYNLDRIRSFLASKAAAAARLAGRRPRATRRRGTWTALLGPQNAAIGSDASGPQTAGAGPDPPPPT
jgi:hypothetical protein